MGDLYDPMLDRLGSMANDLSDLNTGQSMTNELLGKILEAIQPKEELKDKPLFKHMTYSGVESVFYNRGDIITLKEGAFEIENMSFRDGGIFIKLKGV
jgi:uncharacterized protein YukJ